MRPVRGTNDLAAIRSFLHYAAHQEPSALETIQRVQAIPSKRYEQPLLGYLTSEEIQAILEAPNQETWSGARDHAMWATFYNTGARVSEITGMRIADLDLSAAALVRIRGKGRKQRQVPLWRTTRQILARWRERVSIEPSTPVFPNRQGQPLTRSGVEERLRCAVRNATEHVPTLARVHVTPHTLRHTTAMHLLQSGIDITVIALWLGHESIETTHKYIEADLELKRRTLASLEEPTSRSAPRAPTDDLVAFLDSL